MIAHSKVFIAFAEALLPAPLLEKFSLEKVEFSKRIEFLAARSQPAILFALKVSLFLIQLMAWITTFHLFANLSLEKRRALLTKWIESESIFFYFVIRPLTVFTFGPYYSHPLVSKELGFEEPVEREELPPKIAVAPPQNNIQELEVEICVIGSGAGGAVVAKELAERGHQVLVLEEGPAIDRNFIRAHSTFERNSLLYREAGFVSTLGMPPVLLPTGKAVGGTTLINSGTCFRTPPEVLQEWQKDYGLGAVTAESLLPYFEKVEKNLHIGPVPPEFLGKNNEIVARGIAAKGWHGQPLVRNALDCRGLGVCIFGCPSGAKQSMDASYGPMAQALGVQLLSGYRVDRLEGKDGRITHASGEGFRVKAQKFVLACGTLETPLLLKRSGLARQTQALGRNLSIHPTGKVVALFDEVVDGFKGVPQGFSLTDFEPQGLMFESVFFPPWLLATSLYKDPELHAQILRAYRHVSLFGFLVHDASRGRVVPGKDGKPLIFYSLGKREYELFVKGLQILCELYLAAGAKKIYPSLRQHVCIENEADIKKYMHTGNIKKSHLESAAFHPLGTCRMGPDPRHSVVDTNQRLHDAENVWIADGSIFPTSLGVNPQITIMAFATRCAEIIAGTHL